MNSEDTTLPLNEPIPDAPTTQPLLKELLADVRELKTSVALLTEIAQRLETRLDSIDREQRLMRHGMDTANLREHRRDERIMELEKTVFGEFKIAA